MLVCDSSPSPLCQYRSGDEKATLVTRSLNPPKETPGRGRGGGNGDHARPTPGCGVSVSVHPPMPLRSRTRGQPGAASSAAPTAAVYSQTTARAAARRRIVTQIAASAAWNPGEEATRCRLRPAMVPPVRPAPRADCYLLITPRNGGTPLGGSPAALGTG